MQTELRDWGKIAIGTRMNDRCDPLFFNSWSHLIAGGLRKGDTVLDAAVELPQHVAATVMAILFLQSDADTLCTIDTDMIFKQNVLEQLRSDEVGQHYDILSALSVTRRKPFYPIVLRRNKDAANGAPAYLCAFDAINGGVAEVDTVGTGFTLIRRSVFDDMQSKLAIDRWYFQFGDEGLGEDTRFCQDAQKLGKKIAVHTGVCIGHRGPISFVWDVGKKQTMMEYSDQIKVVFGNK